MTKASYKLIEEHSPQLGLVVLQSDETIERDMRRLLPDDVDLLVTRIPSAEDVTPETLAAMEGDLAGAVALFPRAARFEAVGYGCTSGTAQIGSDRIAKLVQAGCVSAAVTEPVSALAAACAHLGVRRLALVSPYVASVSDNLQAVLEKSGLEFPAVVNFEEAEEARVVRIDPSSTRDAAISVAAEADCDAVFLSCTNLRTLDVIEEIEAALDLPVLSSNQVLAWHMLRRAGRSVPHTNPGRLWRI